MIRIRQAVMADIDAMVDLLNQLFSIEIDFCFDAAKHQRALVMMLEQPETASVWVAADSDQVVGMCTVQRLLSTAEGGWVGLLEDLVVTASLRGRGIGC